MFRRNPGDPHRYDISCHVCGVGDCGRVFLRHSFMTGDQFWQAIRFGAAVMKFSPYAMMLFGKTVIALEIYLQNGCRE